MKMLDVNGLKVYHGHAQALRGVTFQAREGEIVAVLGANGAGKSTLLGTLSGIYNAKAGKILFNGKPLNSQSPGSSVKRGLILVPEHRQIFNELTVQDNLLLGAFHRYGKDKNTLRADLEKVLKIFPALQGKEQQTAGILSGGLQQMLAIGRGLMAKPKL